MDAKEAKAHLILTEAEKKSQPGGFFSKFFGKDSSEAVSLYLQAAILFKSVQSWKYAGDSFYKAAELSEAEADSRHDCASHYAEAGNCYRKVDAYKAIECYAKTCEIFTDMGRFSMAAKHHVTIAELYEKEMPDIDKCIEHYQKAADYFKGEEQKSQAYKCLTLVAKYMAQLENYRKAISIFEEMAFWEMEHPTLKYNAKNHFFKALLCYMCSDVLDSLDALSRYENACPSFVDSREYKLIKELTKCCEESDEMRFTVLVANYDKISRLDDWHTRMLLKIKKRIIVDDEDDLK